jgi:hypothetical protein
MSRDDEAIQRLRPRAQRGIVEEPGVPLSLTEKETRNTAEAWLQAEGSISESESHLYLARCID